MTTLKDQQNSDTVFIGRLSKWGNPYKVCDFGRAEAISRYEFYLRNNSSLLADLHELVSKDLICFCSPDPHGDILLKYVHSLFPQIYFS